MLLYVSVWMTVYLYIYIYICVHTHMLTSVSVFECVYIYTVSSNLLILQRGPPPSRLSSPGKCCFRPPCDTFRLQRSVKKGVSGKFGRSFAGVTQMRTPCTLKSLFRKPPRSVAEIVSRSIWLFRILSLKLGL